MDLKGMGISSQNFLGLAIVFISPLLLIFFGSKLKSGGLKLPPSPYAWPVVGNLFNLDGKKPHIALANIAQSLGPLFSLRLGSKIVIVVSNVEAAREVYKFHDRELSGRLVLEVGKRVPGVNDSVIAMAKECDQRWRSIRGMSHTELFSSQALESRSHLRMDKVKEMIQHLSSKQQQGDVVKIADVIFGTMVNSLSMAMTSLDIIQNLDNIDEAKSYMRKLLMFAIPGIGDIFPVLSALDFGINGKANDYIQLIKGLWGDILAGKKGGGGETSTPDLLDILIKNSWDDMQIFNILTEFFASTESMTTACEWALAELTRSPEALVKLRGELEETIGIGEGKVFRERDIAKLPFLQACVKETLRLHPPSPFLVPRVAVESCKLMNYDIPKGSLVITNAYAIGRDPMIWEDSLRFKPERFIGKSLDVKGNNYELLPFGGGRRICAGYPWALKHIQLILASIVYVFDWTIPDVIDQSDVDMGEEFSITLRKKKPMLLILKKRSNFKME